MSERSVSSRERFITSIAVMERPALIRTLHTLRTSFAMDFTDEYLNSLSLDRLRHVVLAAGLHVPDNSLRVA